MPLINFPPVTEKYVARDCDRQLTDLLATPENRIIEINGEAKMGKSCLAAQVLHSMSEGELKEKSVLWINCTDINTVNESVLAIGNALKFLDEKGTETPQKRVQALKDYCTKTPGCIIVCDQVNPTTAPEVLGLFKSNQSDGRLVYTTANVNFTYQTRFQGLPDIKKVSVREFTAEQAKTLVKLHLPSKEVVESTDISILIERTKGNPELISNLCQYYLKHMEFEKFSLFCQEIPEGEKLTQMLQTEFEKYVRDVLRPLQNEVTKSDEVARQALSYLKQAAYLAPQSIPFGYFIDTTTADITTRMKLFAPINRLKALKLMGLSVERSGSLVLSVQLLQTLRHVFSSEKDATVKTNMTQLASKFICYTTDDAAKQKTYAVLAPYVPHVHGLLFDDSNDQESKMDSDEVRSRASLWCSLGRMYHCYLGVVPVSLECFKRGEKFVKKHLSSGDTTLSTLYNREFLAQKDPTSSKDIQNKHSDARAIARRSPLYAAAADPKKTNEEMLNDACQETVSLDVFYV